MKTLMIIFNTPEAVDRWHALSAAEQGADTDLHRDWFREYGAHIAGGEELADAGRSRILRRLNGRVAVTDGPFAEVREVIGGFVILDVPAMADAERIAADWPGVTNWGARIELRPLAGAVGMADGTAEGMAKGMAYRAATA